MRVISLCILFAMFAALPVRADDASKRALAEQLLTAMDIEKNTEKSFEMVKKMMVTQTEQAAKRAGAANATNEVAESTKVIDLVTQEMSWAKLKDRYITIYVDTFTEDELKGIIEFYNSTAGKALTAKQPQLMQKTIELTQQIMMELMPKIQAMSGKGGRGAGLGGAMPVMTRPAASSQPVPTVQPIPVSPK